VGCIDSAHSGNRQRVCRLHTTCQNKRIRRNICWLNQQHIKNKHVQTNQMFDLNIVAKSTSEIKETMSRDIETEEIKYSKKKHDYFLYVTSAITIVCLILFLASCIKQLPWCVQALPSP